MIIIQEVKTRRERKAYIDFQNNLYRNVPQYVPTMMMDEMSNLNPKKNPAFAYCEMRFFVAKRDGKIVGRIGAIWNKKSNELYGEKNLRITRLDFIEDKEVLAALVQAVETWARELGMDTLVGPVGFCDLDKEGMLVDGFERPGLFITYYNFPYYKDYMEAYGFEKDVDWLEQVVYLDDTKEDKLSRLAKRVAEKQGFRILDFKKKRDLEPYIPKVFDLVNSEYEGLYGVVPITEAQKEYYKGQFLSLINLRYISLIESKDGELVAIGICAPSLSEPMRKSNGRLAPFGWIPLLKTIRKPKVLDMYLVAVKDSYRRSGLPVVLMHEVYRRAKEDGIQLAETGPQLESNVDVQNIWEFFRRDEKARRRRSWKKVLTES